MGIIELKEITKTYYMGDSEIHALSEINLNIEKNDFIAIMGPSGSGKSTIMNSIGCLDTPSKGKIILDNKNISSLSESELAIIRGKKIGFIFQQFNLIPTLTALENIMLPMIFQKIPEKKRKERAKELLKLVELENRMNHKPKELSGGQQQRVAIARALANNPEIILADEPTGNLDSKTSNIIIDFLKKLNKEGKTIILVTHNIETARQAKKIFYLKDGKIALEEKNENNN
ncbi:MAG TPA: ABC transporter ATP-binding protein [Candidatus Nanoarchaeia archaeon]|nr:ABC transporter ATP-binding protein [Candidatus Nanoarchaeia archaeon]